MSDVEYRIVRRPRRKTAAIVIRPDNSVEVLAPPRMPVSLIEHFVQSKQPWIQKKLSFNREHHSPHIAKQFVHGEPFQLLGKAYTLELLTGKRSVAIKNDLLLVSHAHPGQETTRRQLSRWYRQQAEAHFKDRCGIFAERIGRQARSVGVKGYKSRWGSCHIDGRVYFNWRLIMAPAQVIDYVVVHELCHLIHHNHSKAYWQLVEEIMPEFRSPKAWLKLHGHSLDL